jgi:hypothetical protein
MHFLHSVHEMKARMVGYMCTSVCLSVHMIQLKNQWLDLGEIWYGCYAIVDYPKFILLISYEH